MPPTSYRGCWHVVSRGFLVRYRHLSASFLTTGVYNPKAFILHAASLDQAFAHCPIFPTAASRRSPGRVSVPVWLVALSRQLPVIALVGRYPANKLIGRDPLLKRLNVCSSKDALGRDHRVLALVSQRYPRLKGRLVTCYSPVRRSVTAGVTTYGPIARLACIKHAASVHPEPGSNPPLEVSPSGRIPSAEAVVRRPLLISNKALQKGCPLSLAFHSVVRSPKGPSSRDRIACPRYAVFKAQTTTKHHPKILGRSLVDSRPSPVDSGALV